MELRLLTKDIWDLHVNDPPISKVTIAFFPPPLLSDGMGLSLEGVNLGFGTDVVRGSYTVEGEQEVEPEDGEWLSVCCGAALCKVAVASLDVDIFGQEGLAWNEECVETAVGDGEKMGEGEGDVGDSERSLRLWATVYSSRAARASSSVRCETGVFVRHITLSSSGSLLAV